MSVERKATVLLEDAAPANGRIKLTEDYRKTKLASSIPDAFYGDRAWWLPPQPDPESARMALKLFPSLYTTEPELVAAAQLSACNHTPIDLATAWWEALSFDECYDWQSRMRRTYYAAALEYRNAKGEHKAIIPHSFQLMDAAYAAHRLEQGMGAYFGWQMGLGKTLGACLVMDAWDVNYAFIACPNNAKHDPWLNDAQQFCPWMKFVVVGNDRKSRDYALDEARERMNAGEPTAVVCHYAAIPIIEKKHGPKTVSGWKPLGRFEIKIADEAHLLKNRTANFTAAFRRLPAVGMLGLSGSVMSGRAEDMFVPWQMFQPHRFRSQWRDWNDPYMEVITDDYDQKVIVGPRLNRLPDFRAMLGETLVVRLAKDHLSVPEATVVERSLAMHPEQRKVYAAVLDDLMAELPDGEFIYATEGAALRSALRQITAGVSCSAVIGTGLISAKHDAALEDIESAGDSQIVMFSWHRKTAAELQRRCLAASIPCGLVSGDFSVAQREREIDLFKRGGYRVLAATIKTLSSAANLQNASIVGMLEESDDPVDNEQAIGRVVRQGQPAHATVYTYRIENSVDDLSVHTNAITKSELRRLILGTK